MVTEDCLAVIEVWSSRVFKGLDDDCPLSDMKSTDEFAVCQLEYPLVSPDTIGGSAAGAAASSPAKNEAGSPSSSGQTSSQGTGEADGKASGGTAAAAVVAGGGEGASVLIDIVISTHPNSALKGRPQRMTCRCVSTVVSRFVWVGMGVCFFWVIGRKSLSFCCLVRLSLHRRCIIVCRRSDSFSARVK